MVKGSDGRSEFNDFKPPDAQPITGYGDQAYYDGMWLSVLKDGIYVRISVRPAGAAPSLPDEEQLATAILPKL